MRLGLSGLFDGYGCEGGGRIMSSMMFRLKYKFKCSTRRATPFTHKNTPNTSSIIFRSHRVSRANLCSWHTGLFNLHIIIGLLLVVSSVVYRSYWTQNAVFMVVCSCEMRVIFKEYKMLCSTTYWRHLCAIHKWFDYRAANVTIHEFYGRCSKLTGDFDRQLSK